MKKPIIILGLSTLLLTACDSTGKTIVYENKRQSVSKVEEKLEDKLEAENPKMDLEISIYEDDDKKKKKRKKK